MNREQLLKMKPVDRLVYWINERESIRRNKESNMPKPWTEDDILRNYRFCNVHREDDKVTKWIASNWREPNKEDPDLWFAMAVSRFINWPETLRDIKYPVPWNINRVKKIINKRIEKKQKVWTGAYVVSTNGRKMSKPDYILKEVLTPLWRKRKKLRPQIGQSLQQYSEQLKRQMGFSGFMTGQVIADIKYVDPLLNHARDWYTWAISGPGSRRGMNRVHNLDKGTPIGKEEDWHRKLLELQDTVLEQVDFELHAQDLQNCLCEFDKFERVLHNEGKPRSRYNGGRSA